MARRAIYLAALLPVIGCGTVANQVRPRHNENGKDPFGGVKHDVASIHAPSESGDSLVQCKQAAKAVLCVVDLPFSALGDVLLWPYTTAYNFINAPVPAPPLLVQATAPTGAPTPAPTEMPAPTVMPTPAPSWMPTPAPAPPAAGSLPKTYP